MQMDIRDERNVPIDITVCEKDEQELARKHIQPTDVVLELGGRYGSVSCIINKKLNCPTNQVVVEPDERVWDALERNKEVNGCNFHILKGFISKKKLKLTNLEHGYGTTSTQHIISSAPCLTLDQIKQKYKLKFNVLVADCEGFLESFFDENPELYDELQMVIFEADYPQKCNYDKIKKTLVEKGFTNLLDGFQNVYSRV
jgi:FkbM family methyltransferase